MKENINKQKNKTQSSPFSIFAIYDNSTLDRQELFVFCFRLFSVTTVMERQQMFWFDAHIGMEGSCKFIRNEFDKILIPILVNDVVEQERIDLMICSINETMGPITYFSSVDAGIESLKFSAEDGKQITVIVSGTLGVSLLEQIKEQNISVESYYIFCGYIPHHIDWALVYIEKGFDIQMFDFPKSLLIRLSRDFSKKLINQGEQVLDLNPNHALQCFLSALSLAEAGVSLDTPLDENDHHRPSVEHRRILQGENGLIARARKAAEEQNRN